MYFGTSGFPDEHGVQSDEIHGAGVQQLEMQEEIF
jgi:hypothetical protein